VRWPPTDPRECRIDPLHRPQPSPRGALLDARDPWRIFFPLGVILAWAGVLHWLLFALGAIDDYRIAFHATVQIQGFLTSIAVGFLYTFVPRRTGTAAPSAAEMVAGATAPIALTFAAWQERWALAEGFWAAGLAIVAAFVVRRLRSPGGAPGVPSVFVWVPVALFAGIAGAALVGVAAVLDPFGEPAYRQLGRGLLLQGFVSALVVGVGGTMLPQLTRGEPARLVAGRLGGPFAQLAAALLFLASFPLEIFVDTRLGFALRAAVVAAVVVPVARLWRLPTAPGLHRRLIWIAAWLLPAGYAAVVAAPALRTAFLHVALIGSFGLMTLSVSLHVALSHGGRSERLARWTWQVWAMGLLVLAALAFRVLVGLDADHRMWWLGAAAASFLLATIAWASLVLPAIRWAGARGR
jgi:uncharacterized protein involved in response to NO